MTLLRKLELICGLATGAFAVGVILEGVYVTYLTSQTLNEPPQIAKALAVSITVYGAPALLVAVGSYLHTVKRQSWGRVLLIMASLFLATWFFLSLVVLVWSKWILLSWLILLLTVSAVLCSIASLLVRRNT